MSRKLYLDLGANNGLTVRAFLESDPDFSVVAFEPNPELARSLRSVYASPGDNVHIMEYAVWIADGVTRFFLGSDSDQSSTVLEGKAQTKRWRVDYSNSITVQTIDFDRWLRENISEQDYVIAKMDIEGAEYKVLQRMMLSGSLKLLDEIRVEWHWQRYPTEASESEHRRIREAVSSQCKLVDWI